MQLVNRAQFLNVACLFFTSACLATASAPNSVTVVIPFTSIYELL